MLVAAGRRYEGPIAFNPDADNVNSVGLIEAYTTILDRGKHLSIDNATVTNPTQSAHDALLLAASKIANLYLLLGNEAFADAEDPTIGFTTSSGEVGSLAPSIFAFQNQEDSLLEEELALLRGVDRIVGSPAYNRLLWNFTGGEGQIAYKQVYNITDTDHRNAVTGKLEPKDGFINADDAAVFYPQGHGDAWGHYLTGLKTYYELLRNQKFSWVPRTEQMLLAGVPIEVDYLDERKFAALAAAKAKAGGRIVDLTYHQKYEDDPKAQWHGYRDTDQQRAWGVTDWARRAGQGAYFDWVVANAILPAEDPNPGHRTIQQIDRTTVEELREIASNYEEVQAQEDKANAGLNPLGLAKGALTFDIDLAEGQGFEGKSHFDQVHERALKALNNALGVFNHANQVSQSLRTTQDSATSFAGDVAAQEREFKNRLIEIFGYPYEGHKGRASRMPRVMMAPTCSIMSMSMPRN
ncbi:MAG: hypothetical protein L0Z50_12490 [Verrucomicrobiales bacterium]|nr:hypothetical protein [Verrucomicrobiales bacterium]